VLLPGSTTTKAIDLAVACALLADDVQLGGDINVVRMKSASSYDPIFMANLLTHTQKLAIADLAQGSTIIHLYGRALLNLKLKLPVITEQAAIATVLSDMDTEITSLESRLAKTHELKQGMMQELLTGRTRLV
jgi:type I restriction enzyme S subunit